MTTAKVLAFACALRTCMLAANLVATATALPVSASVTPYVAWVFHRTESTEHRTPTMSQRKTGFVVYSKAQMFSRKCFNMALPADQPGNLPRSPRPAVAMATIT